MVQGKDRRPELGYKMALLCRFANLNFLMPFDLVLFITFHFFQLRSFSRDAITYPAKNKNSKYNDVP